MKKFRFLDFKSYLDFLFKNRKMFEDKIYFRLMSIVRIFEIKNW